MATATELITQAEEATTSEELDAIEAQAEGRVTVLQAVEEARERLKGGEVAVQVEEGLAHLAGDVTMPDVDGAAEWDVLEDFPTFTEGQWATVDGAGLLEIVAINQSTQGRLTVRNHGTAGNQSPGTLVYAGTAIVLAAAPPAEPGESTKDPDFVWVGHGGSGDEACWTPKDSMRPVLAYSQWLADGFRYLTYRCDGCQREVHSTLWAFWLEDAKPFIEGSVAAESTEVLHWGN